MIIKMKALDGCYNMLGISPSSRIRNRNLDGTFIFRIRSTYFCKRIFI